MINLSSMSQTPEEITTEVARIWDKSPNMWFNYICTRGLNAEIPVVLPINVLLAAWLITNKPTKEYILAKLLGVLETLDVDEHGKLVKPFFDTTNLTKEDVRKILLEVFNEPE